MGLGQLSEMRRVCRLLRAMDGSLMLLGGEIELCARSLPEVFNMLGRKSPEPCRGFFACLAVKCEFMSAAEAWEGCCELLELPEAAKGAIRELAPVLGVYDASAQCAAIAAARNRLAEEYDGAKERMSRAGKSYPMLGFCLAGIAALMIM